MSYYVKIASFQITGRYQKLTFWVYSNAHHHQIFRESSQMREQNEVFLEA